MVRTKYKNGFTIHTVALEEAYTVVEKQHQGKKHLVIPVTMMVEGVHSGSHGPLLHTIEELGRFPEAWNGIPVVIDHPNVDGQNVSANSPDIIDSRTVGRIYNTHVNGNRLKAEAWIDEDKLRQVSSATLAMINDRELVEVSLGVFSDEEAVEGDWNGETYQAIAKNHRPDHLALLPGGTGACSCEDGCGLRANRKKGVKNMKNDLLETMRTLNEEGFSISVIGDHSAQGYKELVDAVRRKLDGMDTNDSYHMLEEVYEDTLIYNVHFRVGESKLYKQGYSFNSGVVDLTGDPVEVRKKVEYVANTIHRTKFSINHKMEDNKMSKNECPKCVEKINALIANKESGWTEDDREKLDTFSEAQLDRLFPKEKIVEKKIEVNVLTPAQEADLAFARTQRAEKRSALTQGIQANTSKEMWPDAELEVMSEGQLERLYNSVKKEEKPDFSINAGGQNLKANAEDFEVMLPAGVEVETKK